MNKKFLSAILFGALMVSSTGTFVSCKDYDDDIENLQGQIDKLATKEDMTSQIASLQSALETAKTEAAAAKAKAEEAVKKVSAAESAATEAEKAAAKAALDAANAKAEAVKAAQAEVAKVKAELEASIDAKFEAEKNKLAATIDKLTEKVEKLTGLTTQMITSIDIQTGNNCSSNYNLTYSQMPDVFMVGGNEVKSKEFGKGFEGAFVVNAGEIFTNSSSNVFSIAPANAVLANEMLSLINSKGANLDAFVELSAAQYKGLLTRGAAATGLYAVSVKLKKDADLKAFAKAVETSDGQVGWALAATKEGRTVTSTYDLTLEATKENKVATGIAENSKIKSDIEKEAPLSDYPGFNSGTTINNEKCYPVVLGKAFTIKMASAKQSGKLLASYVTVDYDNSALSTTDKAALKGMTFEGVNAVSKTNKFNITIKGDHAKGVVVPLKVKTIDFLGNETEIVVWVKAGGNAEVAQTVSYVITPTQKVSATQVNTYAYSGMQKFTVPAAADKFDLSVYAKNEVNIKVDKQTVLGNTTFKFFEADGKTVATAVKDIANAQLNVTVDLQTMKDSKVYEGVVKFFDAEGTFLSQSVIKVQKVLPTTLPEGFSIKTNQLDANGVYNCYLVPNSWTAITEKTNNGTMDMNHVFNFGKGGDANYDVTFADAAWKNEEQKVVKDNKVQGDQNLVVPNAFIDNKTQHKTTVVYNYGAISSEKKDGETFLDYTIEATSFQTVFNCIYNDTYSWRWATREDLGKAYTEKDNNGEYKLEMPYSTSLTYGTNATGIDFAQYIKGISARDGQYSKFLSAPYQSSLKIKEAHLVSDGNKVVDEYFKVTFAENAITKFVATQVSDATNPTAAVASTLVVTVYDMYGHEFDIKLPMTINKR